MTAPSWIRSTHLTGHHRQVADPGPIMTQESPRTMTNIAQALDAFLAEQRARLSERTYRRYHEVIGLLQHSMNDYGPNTLDEAEYSRWEAAYDDDPDAFVNLFGPEKIPGQLGEFLGWFMVRKVMAGQELLKAAGTVTKKLSKWLETNDHISTTEAAVMADQAADAAVELPAADKRGHIIYEKIRKLPRFSPDDIADEHWLEDMFTIERVEPGKLWLSEVPEPVKVPRAASDLARQGWAVTGTVAKIGGQWRFAEIGNVYP